MEVGTMMGLAHLHEHPDDDPEEARELGHVVTLYRRRPARLANVMPFSRERRCGPVASRPDPADAPIVGCNGLLDGPSVYAQLDGESVVPSEFLDAKLLRDQPR
jgi:hypothetical protein